MSKSYKTTKTLIIVESPAKCKKIEEYLGPGYKCVASCGHLRELKSLNNIDIQNGFKPNYSVIDTPMKRKTLEILRKEIKNADEVILASDGDREGEKIAYCVAQIFNLDINKTKRITFNEITESALRTAIAKPRTIDMDLVNAQQARQILDILVGFKVSPVLWNLVKTAKGKDNSLSAGRCQTPALKLIYDNQREIDKSDQKRVYNTIGYFTGSNLPFDLNKQIEDEDAIIDFLDSTTEFQHIYSCSQPSILTKLPPEPFTTSRIQQVASNELHYSPKETMRLCQQLYEGGYITYMRTDSKVYSEEFIETIKNYITTTYSSNYINKNIRMLMSNSEKESSGNEETLNEPVKTSKKSKTINKADKPDNQVKKNKKIEQTNLPKPQEAHEAIRPTNISLQTLPEELDSKVKRMYKLIWTTTLESCMAAATYNSITSSISAPLNLKYTYSTELIDFPGWKIVENKFPRENKEYLYLQTIKSNAPISVKKVTSKVTIKGSKQHFTEARLVQLLEERGIGRPSTFSSLVDKIQERGYVKKEDVVGKEYICREFELEDSEIFEMETKREFGNEKNKLVIQQLGIIVMELLEKYFNSLFNYDYTSNMELMLDKAAKGQMNWIDICSSCNSEIDTLLEGVKGIGKIEYKIDDEHTYLIGKYGPVIKCVKLMEDGKEEITFKAVKKDLEINKLMNDEYTLHEILDCIPNNLSSVDDIEEASTKSGSNKLESKVRYNLGKFEDQDVILMKGKFGLYVKWGTQSKNLKELGNRPMENITFEEVLPLLEKGSSMIREITTSLSIRNGAKGDYIFYKTSKMKKPQFYDIKQFIIETKENYKKCDITILKSWIVEKYNIKI